MPWDFRDLTPKCKKSRGGLSQILDMFSWLQICLKILQILYKDARRQEVHGNITFTLIGFMEEML